MEKKIGSIVFATEQGLGYLARDFYKNGVIDKVIIRQHSRRKARPEWYRDEDICNSIDELVRTCDAFIFFEEVFFWEIIKKARDLGKKTALMPMYECTRNPLPHRPDMLLCPSKLDMQYYEEGREVIVPVDVFYKKRTKARVFIHNAGNGGLAGRNGTLELVQAMEFVKCPLKLIIRSQYDMPELQAYLKDDPRVEFRKGHIPFEDLYSEGDVFVFPEKFNGLSLPLQEAFAAGMLIMAGDRFPINTWLPTDPLIPVDRYVDIKAGVIVKSAVYTPAAIAATMDSWYDKDITKYSLLGREFAEKNSWKNLKEKYRDLLLQ